MRRLGTLLIILAALSTVAWHGAASAQPAASADDTARFLAGLTVPETSPLAPLTSSPAWRSHAKFFDAEWDKLEKRQLEKVRAFGTAHLGDMREKTLFYFFSGPDYLYADAFFPRATTYVLAGLEPVGPIPDVQAIRPAALPQNLAFLKTSLQHLMGFSYFITLDMEQHLARGQLPGTLPVLYVFLSRAGKTIKSVQHMRLEPDGKLVEYSKSSATDKPRAVKITFAGSDGAERTLYYFSTNLSNQGVATSGFLKFCETLAPGDAFLKSASYLLHEKIFSTAREFLQANSRHILQDDTGPPVATYGDDKWRLQPFGKYTRPIAQFSGKYQKQMTTLFDKGKPPPFDFSVGYRWRPGQSNLLLATKK